MTNIFREGMPERWKTEILWWCSTENWPQPLVNMACLGLLIVTFFAVALVLKLASVLWDAFLLNPVGASLQAMFPGIVNQQFVSNVFFLLVVFCFLGLLTEVAKWIWAGCPTEAGMGDITMPTHQDHQVYTKRNNEIEKSYVVDQHSIKDIAAEFSLSTANVRRALVIGGVKLRPEGKSVVRHESTGIRKGSLLLGALAITAAMVLLGW